MPFRFPPTPAPIVEIVGVMPDVITNVSVLEPKLLSEFFLKTKKQEKLLISYSPVQDKRLSC
jgi:hypothetical protein